MLKGLPVIRFCTWIAELHMVCIIEDDWFVSVLLNILTVCKYKYA